MKDGKLNQKELQALNRALEILTEWNTWAIWADEQYSPTGLLAMGAIEDLGAFVECMEG